MDLFSFPPHYHTFQSSLHFLEIFSLCLKFMAMKFFVISCCNILLALSAVSDVPSPFAVWLFVPLLLHESGQRLLGFISLFQKEPLPFGYCVFSAYFINSLSYLFQILLLSLTSSATFPGSGRRCSVTRVHSFLF